MRDFKQQLEAYGDEMKNARCPYGEAELDREIRNVLWNTARADEDVRVPGKRRIWPAVAAAACLLAVITPLGTRTSSSATLDRIAVDGQQVYFACNNGCSADATIATFKTLLR